VAASFRLTPLPAIYSVGRGALAHFALCAAPSRSARRLLLLRKRAISNVGSGIRHRISDGSASAAITAMWRRTSTPATINQITRGARYVQCKLGADGGGGGASRSYSGVSAGDGLFGIGGRISG